MLYLAIKAAMFGVFIALVSEIARRSPGFGALVASLPLALARQTRRNADRRSRTRDLLVCASQPTMFVLIQLLLKRARVRTVFARWGGAGACHADGRRDPRSGRS